MSKSSTSGRKKNMKSKATCDFSVSKETVPGIEKFFLKQPDIDDTECVATKVSVPCPDDAALPSSTFLGTMDCKDAESDRSKIDRKYPVHKASENETSCNTTSKKKTRKPTLVVRNNQITDYFPVRRSSRKTSVCKMTERNKFIEDAILSGKEEGFEVKIFPDKGRGIITTKAFKRGEFVIEYYGELISYEEAKRREEIYTDKENIGCYMYYFRFRNKQYCVDATKETDRLGRLINHSKKGNLKTRTFLIEESPHLVLFASRDIEPGEELSYDYGDRRKAALETHPWLAS